MWTFWSEATTKTRALNSTSWTTLHPWLKFRTLLTDTEDTFLSVSWIDCTGPVRRFFLFQLKRILNKVFLDLSREEGYKVLVECVKEVHRRLIVNLPNFKVQMIDANGVTEMPIISAKQLALNAAPDAH